MSKETTAKTVQNLEKMIIETKKLAEKSEGEILVYFTEQIKTLREKLNEVLNSGSVEPVQQLNG